MTTQPPRRAFGEDIIAQTEPDPMNYWKPEEGDILFGWIAGIRTVPNNFYDANRPQEGSNQPTQQVALVIEDQTEEPVLVYASGAVLRRLFERGPSKGIMRPPRLGDHIVIKRLADDAPRMKGQKGMKQFTMQIDPEPPTMPAFVSQAMSQFEVEEREHRKALRDSNDGPMDDVSDLYPTVNGTVVIPEDEVPF
jgi:hypothetical protein